MLTLQDKFELYRLSRGKLQQLFKSPMVELCSFFDGTGQFGSFNKAFMKVLKVAAPNFAHKCPFVGIHNGQNVTFSSHFLALYPSGSYRFKLSMSADRDVLLFRIDINFALVSIG